MKTIKFTGKDLFELKRMRCGLDWLPPWEDLFDKTREKLDALAALIREHFAERAEPIGEDEWRDLLYKEIGVPSESAVFAWTLARKYTAPQGFVLPPLEKWPDDAKGIGIYFTEYDGNEFRNTRYPGDFLNYIPRPQPEKTPLEKARERWEALEAKSAQVDPHERAQAAADYIKLLREQVGS